MRAGGDSDALVFVTLDRPRYAQMLAPAVLHRRLAEDDRPALELAEKLVFEIVATGQPERANAPYCVWTSAVFSRNYMLIKHRVDLKKLGKAVRECRIEANISQERLAELADCHRNYIGLLETGKRNPSYIRLIEVASALGMSLGDLVEMAAKLK